MKHLVTAVAGPQADILRFLHNVAGPLMVQNVKGVGIGQHRFLYKHPAQPCFRDKE